jgi:septal ring factor EnvC (AmiA/AmiB activator)
MAIENTKLDIKHEIMVCIQALLQTVKTKLKKIRKTIIACCICFALGFSCSCFVCVRHYTKQSNSDRQLVQQYRDDAAKSNAIISSLQDQIAKQSDDYNRLESNNNNAVAQLSKSIATISSTDGSVQQIRQAVRNIRAAVQTLQNNNQNRDTHDSSADGSDGIASKKVGK